MRQRRDGTTAPVHPDVTVVGYFLTHADVITELPLLRQVVQVPIFAPDGTLVTEVGYSASTGTWYDPPPGVAVPTVPVRPLPRDLAEAKRLLKELVYDFPFRSRADSVHALALGLNPLVRMLYEGPSPLHGINAPVAGTGKGMLVHAMLVPVVGPTLSLMTEGESDAEWRKRITAKLATGSPVVLIDNVRKTLDSEALSSALTSTSWEDRKLQYSRMITLPNWATWVATGNNLATSKEVARRTVPITLDANVEHPWERTGFRHPDLIGWACEYRGLLTWALLVLGRHWVASGRPPGSRTLGSYDGWARTLGGVLEAAGIEGFLEGVAEFHQKVDESTEDDHAFILAWWQAFQGQPVTAADLVKVLARDSLIVDTRSETRRTAQRLRKLEDTVHGSTKIVRMPGKRTPLRYRIVLLPGAETTVPGPDPGTED